MEIKLATDFGRSVIVDALPVVIPDFEEIALAVYVSPFVAHRNIWYVGEVSTGRYLSYSSASKEMAIEAATKWLKRATLEGVKQTIAKVLDSDAAEEICKS